MSLSIFRSSTYLSLLMLLTSCAMGITYIPADIVPIATADQHPVVTLDKQIAIRLDTGYTRTLNAGSQWTRVGSVAQGDIYKPRNAIFTLEGAHVHEAWLVVTDNRLTGFYLPVERGFSPIRQAIALSLSSTLHKKDQ
jgi:hypothetical protein